MPHHTVAVIGGGPGGYETAIRLDQYGISSVVCEAERLGGVCLNWGCIPTKALVRSAELRRELAAAEEYGLPSSAGTLDYAKVYERKNKVVEQLVSGVEFLFQKRRIPVLRERVASVSPNPEGYLVTTEQGTQFTAEYLVIATGSLPKELPGVVIDEENVLSSTGLLRLERLPASLAVVGGGVVGCEFASVFASFGVQVQIIEFLPSILSTEDLELTKRLGQALKKQGIKISIGVGVTGVKPCPQGLELRLTDGSSCTAEKVLLSVGRVPRCDITWEGLEPRWEHGALVVDPQLRTNLPKVYAIGDVTGKLPLAHVASKQGFIVAAHIRSLVQRTPFDYPELVYANVPRCTFTEPELASVGLTEAEARELYPELKIGKFPFSASGKALALGKTFGLVKTVARAADDALLGLHILGPNAAELIAQGAILISLGARASDVERIVFAHPTLSESLMESLEDVHSLSIHKI